MIDFTGRIRCVVVGPLPQSILLLYAAQLLATQQIIHLNREISTEPVDIHSTVALRIVSHVCVVILTLMILTSAMIVFSVHVQYFIQLNNNEGLWLRWGQCLQHNTNTTNASAQMKNEFAKYCGTEQM